MSKFLVYKLTSPSNKVYIGITSKNFNSRISAHVWDAKRLNCRKIHKAINKYGIFSFKKEILHEKITKEEAFKLEAYYIKLFDSYVNGYNQSLGGEGAFGVKRTKQQIDAMKTRTTELFKDNNYRHNHSEKIKSYFENNPEARINIGTKTKERLKDPDYKKELYDKIKNTLGSFEKRLENSKKRGGKPFLVFNLKDEFIKTYDIISDAAKELNLNTSKISLCLKNKRNKHRGYKFKYE